MHDPWAILAVPTDSGVELLAAELQLFPIARVQRRKHGWVVAEPVPYCREVEPIEAPSALPVLWEGRRVNSCWDRVRRILRPHVDGEMAEDMLRNDANVHGLMYAVQELELQGLCEMVLLDLKGEKLVERER